MNRKHAKKYAPFGTTVRRAKEKGGTYYIINGPVPVDRVIEREITRTQKRDGSGPLKTPVVEKTLVKEKVSGIGSTIVRRRSTLRKRGLPVPR